MTKYNKPDYCPEWFNLEDYDVMKEWNRFDWLHNINLRMDLSRDNKLNLNNKRVINIFIDNIKNALIRKSKPCDKKIIEKFAVEELDYQTLLQLFIDCYLYKPELRNLIERSINKAKAELQQTSFLYSVFVDELALSDEKECLYEPVSAEMIGGRFLTTTLLYSNDILESSFKERINKMRANELFDCNGKKMPDKELQSLIEYRVIPYIDLTLWGELIQKPFTVPQLSNLLFPDVYDIDRAERVRKTTKPKALELLNAFPKFI